MTGPEKHIGMFPPRLQKALLAFEGWDRVREIRLRREMPLSLTTYNGNVFLAENGKICFFSRAIRCNAEEIRHLVGSFCGGALYRYFDTLREGYLVDEDGWRLGLCPLLPTGGSSMPELFEGVNLRLPRNVPHAAAPLLPYFEAGPVSTLIVSPPGDGKTTLLRSLATHLSRGSAKRAPLRVAVIDEKEELFPAAFRSEAGMCDVLTGYDKSRGIRTATALFSPEVILCDEIGGEEDVKAMLEHCLSGTAFIATCHGNGIEEVKRRSGIRRLIENGIFSKIVFLRRIPAARFSCELICEDLP